MFDDLGRPETANHFGFYAMDAYEQQKDLMRRLKFIYQHPELSKKYFKNFEPLKYPYKPWVHYFQAPLPGLGLNYSMFMMTVQIMANEEQRARWLEKIRHCDIFGCYAQTELGHGSFVAGIETTATLDKATDEFVIHTPNITATKFWPGDLGRFSSHAVVFARLLIDEKDHGVQPFMV